MARLPWIARVVDALAEREMSKKLNAVPKYPLAMLGEDTLARVCGVVAPYDDEVLVAPLSGRSCVYYHAVVDIESGGTYRLEVAGAEDGMAFVLDDAGSHAVVDPGHAQVSSGFDFVQRTRAAKITERQERFLDRLGFRKISMFNPLRFREAVLEVGEMIAVVGAGVREADPDAGPAAGYRESGATRLRLTGTRRFPLVITDDPKLVY